MTFVQALYHSVVSIEIGPDAEKSKILEVSRSQLRICL